VVRLGTPVIAVHSKIWAENANIGSRQHLDPFWPILGAKDAGCPCDVADGVLVANLFVMDHETIFSRVVDESNRLSWR
jgi:hypothetical protein